MRHVFAGIAVALVIALIGVTFYATTPQGAPHFAALSIWAIILIVTAAVSGAVAAILWLPDDEKHHTPQHARRPSKEG